MKIKDKILETLEGLDTAEGNMLMDMWNFKRISECIQEIGDDRLKKPLEESLTKIFEDYSEKEFAVQKDGE